jgi:hypothetical protein
MDRSKHTSCWKHTGAWQYWPGIWRFQGHVLCVHLCRIPCKNKSYALSARSAAWIRLCSIPLDRYCYNMEEAAWLSALSFIFFVLQFHTNSRFWDLWVWVQSPAGSASVVESGRIPCVFWRLAVWSLRQPRSPLKKLSSSLWRRSCRSGESFLFMTSFWPVRFHELMQWNLSSRPRFSLHSGDRGLVLICALHFPSMLKPRSSGIMYRY